MKPISYKNRYKFIIIPYRDQYFVNKFGWTVRDLMIIHALNASERVESIIVVNRPVSIYERLISKKKIPHSTAGKIKFIDTTSFDLIGPLKKRSWTTHCFDKVADQIQNLHPSGQNSTKVLLDFTPIAQIDYQKFEHTLIWYDLIDNFVRHNRFTRKQKQLVEKKYQYVQRHADLITGVTKAALQQFIRNDTLDIANGILDYCGAAFPKGVKTEFGFGFVGFITDKLDVNFLLRLAHTSKEKIAIFGEAYDAKIKNQLKRCPEIEYFGSYTEKDLPEIMKLFEIGLIPYRESKSHDGSPIKLYQYFNFGRPVISNQFYEDDLINSQYACTVKSDEIDKAYIFFQKMKTMRQKKPQNFFQNIRMQITNSILWSKKVELILSRLDQLTSQKNK